MGKKIQATGNMHMVHAWRMRVNPEHPSSTENVSRSSYALPSLAAKDTCAKRCCNQVCCRLHQQHLFYFVCVFLFFRRSLSPHGHNASRASSTSDRASYRLQALLLQPWSQRLLLATLPGNTGSRHERLTCLFEYALSRGVGWSLLLRYLGERVANASRISSCA